MLFVPVIWHYCSMAVVVHWGRCYRAVPVLASRMSGLIVI